MPIVKLTDKFIRNAPRPERGRTEFFDALTPGFALRVSSSADMSWVVFYRVNGHQRRATIGKPSRMSLAEARIKAAEAMKQADAGIDVVDERRAAQRRGLEVRTVAHLLDAYVARYCRRELSQRGADEAARIAKRDLAPALGRYLVTDLRKAIVAEHLDSLAETAPMSARNAFKVIRAAYRWAAGERGIIDVNPLAGLGSPARDVRRDRVLADDELRILWRVWTERRVDPKRSAQGRKEDGAPFYDACKVMLLTGQRVQEVAQMRWPELDAAAKLWEIPAARVKTRAAQIVPLSAVALAIIEAQPRFVGCEFVFTSGRTARKSGAVNAGALNGWSKAKASMDAAAKVIGAVGPWRLQDLRRTARTLMSRAAVPFEHAERVLGHVIPGIAGVYDRHLYAAEKRAALEKLAEIVSAIVSAPGGNVSSLAAHRAAKTR
ncbi:MAG: integrase arm-type DNA-binding domain-containing protein [Alphaproteobacteria bacterium]|nr:integrase arm-type DNA-binding domain-containing protein [Alphaproteobacteria bacterium]